VEYVEMAHLVAREPRLQKRVYVCHESLAVAAMRNGASEIEVARAARFERKLLHAFDCTIALSDVDAEALRALSPNSRVEVAPSGTMVEDPPEPKEHSGAPTIAFVGYYKHAPNVDGAQWLATEILPLVRAQVPDARLRLIGRNAPASVAELAQPGIVEVAGYVEDLAQALADATAIALPLRTGGGLRGKLLEAWAAGKPVVATPVACEGVEAEGGVHCLIADDAREFADSLVALLRDESLRLHLGASGRLLARQRYSVEASVDRYDAVCRELCQRAKEPKA
jgi:glycosyltransferase involved in cell wall biosynthesis